MTTADLHRLCHHALANSEEQYIVVYDHAHKQDAYRTWGRWASDPNLSFSWYDAAKISQEMREEACQGK